MNQTVFTVEEENLICAFDTTSRIALINNIREAMNDFDEDADEMREIAEGALRKLEAMDDAEFSALILSPAYDDDETEV